MVKLTELVLTTLNDAKYAKRIRRVLDPLMAKEAESAYTYARYVLNGPFPEGEAAIATDAYFSYHYAIMVLGNRFELGEPIIARNPTARRSYIFFMLTDLGMSKEEANRLLDEAAKNG